MTESLFGPPPRESLPEPPADAPLAERMRPRSLEEILGQDVAIGPGTVIRRLIDEDRLPSLILWGPPGSGKTSLARALAVGSGACFEALSAVLCGVKDVRKVVARARERRSRGERTLLFVDEIHRFNKAQQDAFLPHVESGTVTLIGATTENPSYHVNAPLLSRCRLVVLERIDQDSLATLARRALGDTGRGLGARELSVDEEGLRALAASAHGDARALLNILDAAAGAADDGTCLGAQEIVAAAGGLALGYDRAGDEHYNLASALQKSIRSGDVQAGIYWCVRMLEAGEDPQFVARRLVVMASEDVGMAQPFLLPIVMAARDAVHFLGMPEGGMALVQAVVALASAPKSDSVAVAVKAVKEEIRRTGALPVPGHLRRGGTQLLREAGWGRGYQYAHDRPGALVDQEHLPEGLGTRDWYVPGPHGREPDVARHMERLAAFRAGAHEPPDPAP